MSRTFPIDDQFRTINVNPSVSGSSNGGMSMTTQMPSSSNMIVTGEDTHTEATYAAHNGNPTNFIQPNATTCKATSTSAADPQSIRPLHSAFREDNTNQKEENGAFQGIGSDGACYEYIPLDVAPAHLRAAIDARARLQHVPLAEPVPSGSNSVFASQLPTQIPAQPSPNWANRSARKPVTMDSAQKLQPRHGNLNGNSTSKTTYTNTYHHEQQLLRQQAQCQYNAQTGGLHAPRVKVMGRVPKRVIKHTIILQDEDDEPEPAPAPKQARTDPFEQAVDAELVSAECSTVTTSSQPATVLSVGECERACVIMFSCLSAKDLAACARVCSAWHEWIHQSTHTAWTHITLRTATLMDIPQWTGIAHKRPITLDLSWASMSTEELQTCLRGNDRLRHLHLSACHFSVVCRALPALESDLHTLDLHMCEGCTDSAFKDMVAASVRVRRVQHLNLSHCAVTNTTVRLLANQFAQLRTLDLSHCHNMDNKCMKFLVASGHVAALQSLSLSACPLISADIFNCVRRYPSLRELDVTGCDQLNNAQALESIERVQSDMNMIIKHDHTS